ncbi:MAG: DUF5719 family protein [Actinomycetota bacterium]
MSRVRRVPGIVFVALAATAVVVVDRAGRVDVPEVAPDAVVIADAAAALPPAASNVPVTSSAWYCPGVPLGGKGYDGSDHGGEAIVANPTDDELTGIVTRYVDGSTPQTNSITVAPRDKVIIDLDEGVDGRYASALIELTGVNGAGGAVVEQRADFPAGESYQPCGNAPSDAWYFADGFTASDSEEDLVLTNPLVDATVINVRFVTKDGERAPSPLQGFVLPPQSLSVIKIAEQGARGEELVGVEIRAQSGAFVAARAQHYLGTGRLGYTLKLGAPAAHTDWWVVTGNYAGKPAEQIDVFNPGENDAMVSVLFSGSDAVTAQPLSLVVPSHRVVSVSMANVAGLPESEFVVSLSVLEGDPVVVEHAVTRQLEENAATSVDLALPSAMAATKWRSAIGAEAGRERALLVFNITGVDATASVASIGPAGRLPAAGLESIALPAGRPVYVSIPESLDLLQYEVTATQPVLVVRMVRRATGVGGRDIVPALPVLGGPGETESMP